MSEFSDFCLYNKTWWKNCTLVVSIQLYYLVIILHYAPRVDFCLLIFGYLVSAQGLVDLTEFYTGISMESPVVTSCGTGVTACILALVLILPTYFNPSCKNFMKVFPPCEVEPSEWKATKLKFLILVLHFREKWWHNYRPILL